ncbi:MAG: DUF3098 domain-containing protein [Bacteroidetes bacterium]|nr:DUF3098 domain-containing protein [Bacteroidota bacterium]
MAKETKVVASAPIKKKADETGPEFAFGKENFIILYIGLALIVLGFIFMLGGGSNDPKVFNNAIYDFQRLTLAPILILAGFVVELFAIMKKPKE